MKNKQYTPIGAKYLADIVIIMNRIEEENTKGNLNKVQHWFSYLQGYVKAIQHTKIN